MRHRSHRIRLVCQNEIRGSVLRCVLSTFVPIVLLVEDGADCVMVVDDATYTEPVVHILATHPRSLAESDQMVPLADMANVREAIQLACSRKSGPRRPGR